MMHLATLALALTLCACGGLTAPSGAPDASSSGDSADASGSCASGVCGTAASIGSGAQCAQQFPSSGCLGGVCCVLAANSGPPFIDAAAGCFCASPDDIACAGWYRLPGGPGGTCGYGSLCCASAGGGDR
jgi:hypothetical protein